MPRKGHTPKRDVLADPIYKDKIVTKLINNIMLDGKKGIAQKIVYGAFDKVAERSGKPSSWHRAEIFSIFRPTLRGITGVLMRSARTL